MKLLHIAAKILVIIGALNWGLIGFFQYDLVGMIFGSGGMMQMDMMSMGTRVIFALVGLAGLYVLYRFVCKCCGGGCCGCGPNCNCGSKRNDWKDQ